MWPPKIKEFQNIALDALHQFEGTEISVLFALDLKERISLISDHTCPLPFFGGI